MGASKVLLRQLPDECQKRGTTCTRSTIQLSVHHVGQMERAYHERCPTVEAYRLHDDDDDGDIYFVGTHVVKRCLRPRSHGSGSRRLNSAAIVCMFHQRSIARSLRSASRWGSICRKLRSAATGTSRGHSYVFARGLSFPLPAIGRRPREHSASVG